VPSSSGFLHYKLVLYGYDTTQFPHPEVFGKTLNTSGNKGSEVVMDASVLISQAVNFHIKNVNPLIMPMCSWE